MSVLAKVFRSASAVHDGEIDVQLVSTKTTTPLLNVTRITLELGETGITIDSSTTPAAFSWTDEGLITFKVAKHNFGGSVPAGAQDCRVVAYDPSRPNGRMIIHPESKTAQLILDFVD